MSNFKQLIEGLGPSGAIGDFIASQGCWSENHARNIGLSSRFVVSRALLHLPGHNADSIIHDANEVILDIEPKITFLGEDYKFAYNALKRRSGIDDIGPNAKLKGRKTLHVEDDASSKNVGFKDVAPDVSSIIQDKLHYIGCSRMDSVLDCGLYLDGASVPYAYASFSNCKRNYQVDSLNQATGLDLKLSEVISMTRAFAFDSSPANSMSKLFQLSHLKVKRRYPECRAIITALNPFLKFNGGIFTGSSYTPYALSPMEYWYDKDGLYAPRSKGFSPQKIDTPPIVWLAHGLDNAVSNALGNLGIGSVVTVSKDRYRNG